MNLGDIITGLQFGEGFEYLVKQQLYYISYEFK